MNLWDKKAKSYARYNQKLNSIQEQSFKELEKLNISFKDKKIIDIGCGTGVWTLHLAQNAKEITALDNAKAMLEILKEDANKLQPTNIKYENCTFTEWINKNQNAQFDIAFLSMSPALQDKKDYLNFMRFAKIRIYLGWADYRKSDFLDPIFKHFNTEFKGIYKQDLESYLLENNVKFHKFIFDETRIVERKKDEAIENTLWHLNMNGVKASKQDLETFVKGDIKETIQSKIKLLVF
ncbi:class I SAM-dependent methyltransferase [Campylobacter coli]|nr:class I SAM-dependent methyltransferase [Campylobacter coli]